MMKNRIFFFAGVCSLLTGGVYGQDHTVWKIGNADRSTSGMALAPNSYQQFLERDFGWEDRFYLVGFSNPETDFPYVLPGPKDSWGGTGPTSGIRSHVLNILFGLPHLPVNGKWNLVVDVLDNEAITPPLFKVTINGISKTFQLTGGAGLGITGDFSKVRNIKIVIPLTSAQLQNGGNEIQLTTLSGSWLVFDQIKLEGTPTKLTTPKVAFVRRVKAAGYELKHNGVRFQPLLTDIEYLSGKPRLTAKLDGKQIFAEVLETGRYQFEIPMPAVKSSLTSSYEIFCDGKLLEAGKVRRVPQAITTAADYVTTRMGTAHSRWMIAPGPWMPFSMVKLSPDNQNAGWQAGYDPTIESVGMFSHIHEWTMAGLGMLPVNGALKIKMGDERSPKDGYRSKIDKASEEDSLGYYKVFLTNYQIKAELTATTRAGFQRYTYPKGPDGRVMIDLLVPSEYKYQLQEIEIRKVNDHRVEGFSKQHSPNTWSGGVSQDYTVHFVIEFDEPIKKFGTWLNGEVKSGTVLQAKNAESAGAYVEFDTHNHQVVQARSGISLVSIANAGKNLEEEISKPFGWNFAAVRLNQKQTWNNLLERVSINSNDSREKMRFYTNMYRALCSRNTWSDVDGKWVDATEVVRQLKDPDARALGCDAFWNTFWNLNQFWNLVTPEWSSRWVKSQLAMFDANGWLAKGPAGMEYVPVMVAEHEIPLIVGAYQMGIRDYDVEKAFKAVYKMQTVPAQKVGDGLAGNPDLEAYLKYHYVPYDKGRFSNSLEYAYDDWTVSEFAASLGKEKEREEFKSRSGWWKNIIDKESGYARLRKADGTWFPDFDPFKSGANEHYVEGNAWQLTFFVPQDIPGLANLIGKDKFSERLEWGFGESYKWRFNAPNDQYWDYPVIQGNQQSMHFPFLFNWVDKPWLTQKWSRAVMDRYYGYGVANAYLGDEDQGQMSAWFMMASLGLFQTDGGCSTNPIYEIASPLYKEVTINLEERYGRGKEFTIKAPDVSRLNCYVQHATLNGKELRSFWFPASELLKGGELVLQMGPEPNKDWGIANPPLAQ
ncbi:MAG: GH92 family glycosyl hydrolase [Sphingobacteriaceae bacterium]